MTNPFNVHVIQVGDVVWGLHGGGADARSGRGVCWLPATVTKINVGASVEDVTYDLQYFMTQRDLQHARALQASKELMELPSERVPGPTISSSYLLQVKDTYT
jgi:hypothetical protein